MTLPDVTYQKTIILSSEEPEIQNLKYKVGSKFLFKQSEINELETEFQSILKDKKVIISIVGYMLLSDGSIAYTAKYIEPNLDFNWALTEQDIEELFVPLSRNPRMALILGN